MLVTAFPTVHNSTEHTLGEHGGSSFEDHLIHGIGVTATLAVYGSLHALGMLAFLEIRAGNAAIPSSNADH